MSFEKSDVEAVAKLAKLGLSEEDTQDLTGELANILRYINQLAEVNTDGVEPTLQLAREIAPLREDEVLPGVQKDVVLREAPRADEVGFLVPTFVDEGDS